MTGSLIVVLALVFAALFMLALLMTGSTSGGDRGRDVADRIERYGPRHAPTPAGRDPSPARGAVGWVTSLLQSTMRERAFLRRQVSALSAEDGCSPTFSSHCRPRWAPGSSTATRATCGRCTQP
jgi:hypothetical protein